MRALSPAGEGVARESIVRELARIECADGEVLVGEWFNSRAVASSPSTAKACVIVAPAAAVSARFYEEFCAFLAACGFAVLCFDFSAIGRSKHRAVKDDAAIGFSTWITRDYPAVIAHAKTRHAHLPLLAVGHSAGGWMAPINPSADQLHGVLGVAALSGYWRLMAAPNRYAHFLAWHAIVPIAIRLFGYWPGWAGMKRDLPKTLGQEFGTWARDPEFVFGAKHLQAAERAQQWRGHLHLLQMTDDPWGTPQAVADYARRFPNAQAKSITPIEPLSMNTKRIGHFGFFNARHQTNLWHSSVQWLEQMLLEPK